MATRSLNVDEKPFSQIEVDKNDTNARTSANKVCVFDMDGTLTNSNCVAKRALFNLATDDGYEFTEDFFTRVTPLGFEGGTRFYMEYFKVNEDFEAVNKRFVQHFIDAYKGDVPLKDGVRNYLSELKAKGARLFVLSANIHPIVDPCLKSLGLYELFETVWTVDDFGMTKADKRIYSELSRRIGCHPCEINFFDDSVIAIETAKQAGCVCYGVFDNHEQPELLRMKACARRVVYSFNDLLS